MSYEPRILALYRMSCENFPASTNPEHSAPVDRNLRDTIATEGICDTLDSNLYELTLSEL